MVVLMLQNVELSYVSKCSGHPQDKTNSLIQHEEETQDASKQNSRAMVRVSICGDLCD